MPNKLTMAEARKIALLALEEAEKRRAATRERERRVADTEEALDVPAGSASSDGATACNFSIAATAHGCDQVGVDHWQDWKQTKIFSGAATIAMLDVWAKASMGPKAAWNDLILSPVVPNK